MAPIYDQFARHYDRCFAPLERLGLSRYRAEALSHLPAGSEAAILELGCGTGANFEFYPENRIAISTELSNEMLLIARSRRASNFLVNADAQSLPFGESVFDAAFATLVFCSIPDPPIAFAELKRVVKPGGTVILLEHVRPEGMLGHGFDLLDRLTTACFEDHFNRRTAETAANCGLEIKDIQRKLFGAVNRIICTV